MEKKILLEQLDDLIVTSLEYVVHNLSSIVDGTLDVEDAKSTLKLLQGSVKILGSIVDINYENGMKDYEGLCYKLAGLHNEEE